MDALMRYFEGVKKVRGTNPSKFPLPSSPDTFSFS